MAILTFSREFRRAFHRIRAFVKSDVQIIAKFESGGASEATACSHFPIIPYYQKLCNFSEFNGGVGYYCGAPRSPGLSCSDWTATRDLQWTQPLPVTDSEESFNKKVWNYIPTNIKLNVESSSINKPKNVDTQKRNRKEANLNSWKVDRRKGHFYNNVWIPGDYSMKTLSTFELKQCLRNTTVFLNGDSNLRLAFEIITRRLQCQVEVPPKVGC